MVSVVALLALTTFVSAPSDSSIIARVGHYTIRAVELEESFEFGPSFVKTGGGEGSPIRRHLEYMIYERLIALMAQQLRYDTSLFVADRVAALEEDLAVEELYREEILSMVKVSDKELTEAVQKARIHTRFRWIYAKTADEASQLSHAIKYGTSFDSLFAARGDETKSMETTVLGLEKDNPNLARALAGARSQEILGPIIGSDGFYLVRLDEIWQNPIVTQAGEGQLRHEAARIVTSMKAEQLAEEYVRNEMHSANPVIKAEGLNILRAQLAAKGVSPERRGEWEIPGTFMTEAGPQLLSALPEFLEKSLVTFGRRHFSVRDYLRWFEIRQFQLKTSSPEAFASSIKRTIWKMVQDNILSRKAYARGMQLRESVTLEKEKWEAKILYLAGRRHLMRTITIPDSAVRAGYEARKSRYNGKSGRAVEFEEAKQAVRLDMFQEEELKLLHQTLKTLKQKFDIWVDEEAVQRLAAARGLESPPIDVIFYKQGGTFPRRAFPTIDEQWILFH